MRKCLQKLSFVQIRSKLVMVNLINPRKFVLTLIGRIKCPQEFLLRSGILTNQKARKVNCFVYFHTCWRKVPWFFLLAYPIQCKSVISRRDAFTRDFAERVAKNQSYFCVILGVAQLWICLSSSFKFLSNLFIHLSKYAILMYLLLILSLFT